MHGVDADAIDQEELLEMCLMWNAGLVGNGEVLRMLGLLTQVQLNKILPKGTKPYSLKDFVPGYVEMNERLLSPEEQKAKNNEALNQYAGLTPLMMKKIRTKFNLN